MCHACARGRCRQEQQKEMQEHKDKEEMQDEMGQSQEAGALRARASAARMEHSCRPFFD